MRCRLAWDELANVRHWLRQPDVYENHTEPACGADTKGMIAALGTTSEINCPSCKTELAAYLLLRCGYCGSENAEDCGCYLYDNP